MTGRLSMSDSYQYNRIFIIGAKHCASADIREAFEKFGEITDVYIPRAKTNENKGIAYVTFVKASEAALAIEKMNGQSMTDGGRPVKVVLANSKSQGNVRDQREDEKMMRLFIMTPPSFTYKDVEDEFSKFGHVDSVHIIKDRKTGNSRGLAYVQFSRAYDAAVALETCDAKFKAVFADTRRPRGSNDADSYHAHSSTLGGRSPPRGFVDHDYRQRPLDPARQQRPLPAPPHLIASGGLSTPGLVTPGVLSVETVLEASVCPMLNYEQVRRLFDIVPGLDTCNYDNATGKAYVKYSTAQAAAYARDKLDTFEYPIGYRMSVQFLPRSSVNGQAAAVAGADSLAGVQTLVASIQKAVSVLQQHAGAGVSTLNTGTVVPYNRTQSLPYSHFHSSSGKRTYDYDDGRTASARKSSRFS